MKRTRKLIGLLGAALLGVFCFGIFRLVVPARPRVTAFTLKTEVNSFAANPKGVLRYRTTLAMRSDGTRSAVSTLQGRLGEAGETSRTISYMDGRRVSMWPGISAKTTTPRATAAVAAQRRARLLSPPSNCVQPWEKFDGYATLAGQRIAILKSWDVTSWRAPELACEELQYRVYDRQTGGGYALRIEKRLVSLELGEPDPHLFDQRADYLEMKPSDVLRALDKKYCHILEHENCEVLANSDRAYFGALRSNSTRAAQPSRD